MLKKIMITTIISIVFITNVPGQSSGFGVGLILGEPTGISLKSWLSPTTAWDAGIAWGFARHGAFHLHSDYLWHQFALIKVRKGRFPLYYGVGARLLFVEETHVGVRGVIGLNYLFEGIPLDIFIELVPVFDLVPATELYLNGALGLRYFF
jgi:hypothetical protein